MDMNKGILTVKVKEGKLIRDTEYMGTMDPYCTITFKEQKYKTKVNDNGGKTPKWTDEFQLQVTDPTEELMLRCWDQDLTKSDAIGYCKIKCSSLMFNRGVHDWFTIHYEN